MKKLLNIMMVFAVLSFAACNDDDTDKTSGALTIVASDVEFDAAGGSGFISVSAFEKVTAKSSEDWCEVSVSGVTINLNVSINPGNYSRNCLVSITSAGETKEVSVYQLGNVFTADISEIVLGSLTGSKQQVTVRSIVPVNLTDKTGDWFEADYSIENNLLTIYTTEDNPNLYSRFGSITIESAGLTRTIEVEQTERIAPYQEYCGYWRFSATNYTANANNNILVAVSSLEDNTYVLSGLGYNFFTGYYRDAGYVEWIPNQSIFVGEYSSSTYGLVNVNAFVATAGGTNSTAGAGIIASLKQEDDKFSLDFRANEVLSTATGFGFGFFTPTSSSYVLRYGDPMMEKVHDRIVTYQEYAGDWTMEVEFGGGIGTYSVTLEEKEPGKTYTLKGLYHDMEVVYNHGILLIKGLQTVGTYTTTAGVTHDMIVRAAYQSATGWGTTSTLEAGLQGEITSFDNLAVKFISNGVARSATNTYNGFAFGYGSFTNLRNYQIVSMVKN